jgi:hypothetical protein
MLESGRPLMLFFSGADRLHAQFGENFESHYDARLQQRRHLYSVHIIPGANHVMSSAPWVDELTEAGAGWLESRYPTSSAEMPQN